MVWIIYFILGYLDTWGKSQSLFPCLANKLHLLAILGCFLFKDMIQAVLLIPGWWQQCP